MAVEGSQSTRSQLVDKGTLQWRRRWARTRARARSRGGSDGARREQGKALLGLTAVVAQVGQGKKR